jgi:hypothetical protein
VSVVGNLAAGDQLNQLIGYILRFNPENGRFFDVFASNQDRGCAVHLHRPEGLVFGPDGRLYVTAFRADSTDTGKILIFHGATGRCMDQIDLYQVPPPPASPPRAFAQALLFGPGGFLFVPITNTGAVRRYDVTKSSFPFTNFVPSGGPLGQPWYLTFGETDPGTLK